MNKEIEDFAAEVRAERHQPPEPAPRPHLTGLEKVEIAGQLASGVARILLWSFVLTLVIVFMVATL